MKIATYFIKLCGAALIAIGGLVMFFLAIQMGGYYVFNGLAIFGFGAFLVGYVLEKTECPIKFTIAKPQQKAEAPAKELPAAETATAEEATSETTAE
ncbi:MAG: hypothetical protein J6B45_02375 [Clostridia bacterium]|nr:hypothetical protein [Clostridia bacterium]